jgi:hypothetical protein
MNKNIEEMLEALNNGGSADFCYDGVEYSLEPSYDSKGDLVFGEYCLWKSEKSGRNGTLVFKCKDLDSLFNTKTIQGKSVNDIADLITDIELF